MSFALANDNYRRIRNTALQSVSGDVAAAAGVPGLGASFRVLRGRFAPAGMSKTAIVDIQGNQLVLGENDSVAWIGVRNNNTNVSNSVAIYRSEMSVSGAETELTDEAESPLSNGTAPSVNASLIPAQLYIHGVASAGITSGLLEILLVVMTL